MNPPVVAHGQLDPRERPIWPGTTGPIAETPRRRPGSVRSTTTIDVTFPADGTELRLRGRGRDLDTASDGTVQVLAIAAIDVAVDLATRRLREDSVV